MAKRVITELTDDIDGTPADETVAFGFDGAQYEIDLSASNAERLRTALAPFIAAGHRSRRPRGGTPGRTHGSGEPRRAIRDWAIAQGRDVARRGRLPQDVIEQYRAAGGR